MRINNIYISNSPKAKAIPFKQIQLSDEYRQKLKDQGILYENPEDAPIQTWNIPRSMSRAIKELCAQKIDLYDDYFVEKFGLNRDSSWGLYVKKKYDETVKDIFGEKEMHDVDVIITDKYEFFRYPMDQYSREPCVSVIIPSLHEDPVQVLHGEMYCHWALPKYDEIREVIAKKLSNILFPSPNDPPYVKPAKKTEK